MPAYLVTLPATSGQTLIGGNNAAVVFADSVADARAVARAFYDGDSGALWDAATATPIVAPANMEGWTLRVQVLEAEVDVSVVGGAAATVDSLAAQMVTALNALDPISAASYNATSNVLTVAGTADGLGDNSVAAEFIPPGGFSGIPSMVGTIVDGGVAGAALTVALPADAVVLPRVYAAVKA